MGRWNDQIRTVDLSELDKQAHKMIIAYVLGKHESDQKNKDFDWIEVIEAGIFEFLQRIVLTDLKPPLFHRIKKNTQKYQQLNEWVYSQIYPTISCLGKEFCQRFKEYLLNVKRNTSRRVISAAHFYATKWEFAIIERANPKGYLMDEIRCDIESKQKKYHDLSSMQKLLNDSKLIDFINICGQLRFQVRWSHVHRVPKTSVLGHMLIVAMLSYLFSLQIKADKNRCINNYFTGLFHDLPEVLTRDVINPVKRSVQGLDDLIKEYEKEEMQRKIYKLIPDSWHAEIKRFTEDEFSDLKDEQGKIQRDGELIKGADDVAAFIEAYLALKNGINNNAFVVAMSEKTLKYKGKNISGVDFDSLYRDLHS